MSTAVLFSLVHATARPFDVWIEAYKAWAERCDNPNRVEYIVCIDDLKRQHLVVSAWGAFRYAYNHGRPCAVDAWNTAAACSSGDILITVADDYRPPEHWDTEIDLIVKARNMVDREFVLDVDNQEGSDTLLPFSFVSRAYYERLGCLFWPEYFGMGADNDFTERARMDGVVIPARDLKFSHPQFPADDPIYKWQHRPEAMEAYHRVFKRRLSEGFPYMSQKQRDEYYSVLRAPGPRAPEGMMA